MQRDLFLVLTIVGSSLCLLVIFLSAIFTAQHGRMIAAEIASGDADALVTRAKSILPLSVFGSAIFVGTWVCYRRYHTLTFPTTSDRGGSP